MLRKRADSFRIALESLRGELRAGRHPMGARLTANDIAGRLNLSQTPVREALSHLAGAGMLEELRGQGFFVPRLTERDVAVLFRLQLDLLLIACEQERNGPVDVDRVLAAAAEAGAPLDPMATSERLLRALAFGASPPLGRHLTRLQDQLAAFRLSEGRALEGLEAEVAILARALSASDSSNLAGTLRAFVARRLQITPTLLRIRESSSII